MTVAKLKKYTEYKVRAKFLTQFKLQDFIEMNYKQLKNKLTTDYMSILYLYTLA